MFGHDKMKKAGAQPSCTDLLAPSSRAKQIDDQPMGSSVFGSREEHYTFESVERIFRCGSQATEIVVHMRLRIPDTSHFHFPSSAHKRSGIPDPRARTALTADCNAIHARLLQTRTRLFAASTRKGFSGAGPTPLRAIASNLRDNRTRQL
jgi:hypothetical protein